MSDTRTRLLEMMDSVTDCPLKNAGGTVVYPVGDGSSGVMLIGEAPGAQEEKLGEPFVGASGKFLNTDLLPSVGLNRDTIYLTNIVKVRPPNNRDPLPEEKQVWMPVLNAEIAAIKPTVIACLGRHSLGHFLPKAKISAVHGTPHQLNFASGHSAVLLPLYHPAVALYNGSMRPVLRQDFAVLRQFMSA